MTTLMTATTRPKALRRTTSYGSGANCCDEGLRTDRGIRYQPIEPGIPLNGPTIRLVIQPAVEAAGLRGDLLAVDGAAVHRRGWARRLLTPH